MKRGILMIKVMNKFNSMEEKTKKILKYGIIFSVFVCAISMFILLTYQYNTNPDLYYIGLSVFQLGLYFIVEFIICAIAVDTIKKQTI